MLLIGNELMTPPFIQLRKNVLSDVLFLINCDESVVFSSRKFGE